MIRRPLVIYLGLLAAAVALRAYGLYLDPGAPDAPRIRDLVYFGSIALLTAPGSILGFLLLPPYLSYGLWLSTAMGGVLSAVLLDTWLRWRSRTT